MCTNIIDIMYCFFGFLLYTVDSLDIVNMWTSNQQLNTNRSSMEKRSYPSWAIGVGWIIAIIPILMIPVGLLHSILSSEGTISQEIDTKEQTIKMYISNSVPTTRFWSNLHQVLSKSTIGKRTKLKVFGRKNTKRPKRDSQTLLRLPMTAVHSIMYLIATIINLLEGESF